jgi:hypothetical protein
MAEQRRWSYAHGAAYLGVKVKQLKYFGYVVVVSAVAERPQPYSNVRWWPRLCISLPGSEHGMGIHVPGAYPGNASAVGAALVFARRLISNHMEDGPKLTAAKLHVQN